MFGYVKVQRSELLVREWDLYRAIYCGTCRAMKKCTGCFSSFMLTYDSVFLSLVRMALTKGEDTSITLERHRCIAHPFKKQSMVLHEEINYSAKTSAMLSYLKIKDDIADSSLVRRVIYLCLLPYASYAKGRARMPELLTEMRGEIEALSELERERVESVDAPAEVFGRLLGDIFAYGICDDSADKSDMAYQIGYRLGKVIYELDAFDDYPKDVKSGSYNPYVCLYGREGLNDSALKDIRTSITLELMELEREICRIDFAGIDAVEHLIKNTLYLGLVNEMDKIEENHKNKKSKK